MRIRRRDGQVFEVKPDPRTGGSPLDVPAIGLNLAPGEMMAALAESRASTNQAFGVSRHATLLQRLLSGAADQALRFDDVCGLLLRLGFDERRHGGSHRIFHSAGVADILNLQPRRDGTAKPYQVRQIRMLIFKHQLASLLQAETPDES